MPAESEGSFSAMRGHGAGDLGSADPFEGETVACPFVNDPAKFLRQHDPGVTAGERRQRGDTIRNLVRTAKQAVRRYNLVDHAPILGGLGIEHLSRKQEIAA